MRSSWAAPGTPSGDVAGTKADVTCPQPRQAFPSTVAIRVYEYEKVSDAGEP